MIVVDASVLVNALTDDGPLGRAARSELEGDLHWAAPEHLVVESFSSIRGRCRGGDLSDRRAVEALDAVRDASIDLLNTRPLLTRMWELRGHVSGYDAAYVAAAEALDCVLVTADARLARANGLHCRIRTALPADA